MKKASVYAQFIVLLLIVSPILYISNSGANELANFLSENKKIGEKYTVLSNSLEFDELILTGKKSIANTRLKDLVPNASKTISDYFIVSNMLFKSDPETSYSFMNKANLMMPDNPYIIFELATHEHRAGNCKTALPLYVKAAKLFKYNNSRNLWAYLTHCHLVLGNYSKAIESWEKADFSEHHISIEKSMYDIFSNRDLELEREKLINSILSGSAKQVCELIEFDKNWEVDWWNIKINKEFLEYDIKLLKTLSQNNKKIESAVGLCLDGIALNNKEFFEFASQAGYWGSTFQLPEEPASSYALIRELIKRKIANPNEILMRYEDQLMSRHLADPNDKKTLSLLAYLYDTTGNNEKLKKIDLHGWKKLKTQKYAESYISRISITSPEYRSTIEDASNDFPYSIRIQKANLALNYSSDKKLDFLAKFIAAQFPNVSDHSGGPDRLNNFMTSLETEINNSKVNKNISNMTMD